MYTKIAAIGTAVLAIVGVASFALTNIDFTPEPEVEPVNKYLLIGKATSSEKQGNYNEALYYYDKILETYPEDFEVLNYKQDLLYNIGRFDEEILVIDKILKIVDESKIPIWLNNKGWALYQKGDKEKAVEILVQANKMMPQELDIKNNLANAYIDLEKYELAQQVLDEILSIDSSNSYAVYGKGRLALKQTEYNKAIEFFDRSLENRQDLRPSLISGILNSKATALANLGKYEEAIMVIDEALKVEPTYVRAIYNKGMILNQLGKYDESTKWFDRAIELSSPTLLNNKN